MLDELLNIIYESKNYNLTPQVIYDFYFASYLFEAGNLDRFNKFIVTETIEDTYDIYINIFHHITLNQILKYQTRHRVDKDWIQIKINDKLNYADLNMFMKKTFRSDMRRRNIEWIQLTDLLEQLEVTAKNNHKRVIFLVDRINNCIHNTGENILSKFDNGYPLILAFDFAHTASLDDLRRRVSKELRTIQ